MVSEKKLQAVKELKQEIKNYPVIGILDMHKLPGRQLHEIRNKLMQEAKIKMYKKIIIHKVFSEVNGLKELAGHIQGEPALLFSKTNPFKLARIISQSKSRALAKTGDIAPADIVVRAGPTGLAPGPVIGELQRVKIPAMVEGDKISIRQDTVVAKKMDVIQKPLADVLAKLGIEPVEIGLTLIAVFDNGTIYSKEVLFIPQEEYIENLKSAHRNALNLSISIGYFTKENIPFLLSKAHNEACSLSVKAGLLTKETAQPLLAKAHSQAKHLKDQLKIEVKQEAEEKTE